MGLKAKSGKFAKRAAKGGKPSKKKAGKKVAKKDIKRINVKIHDTFITTGITGKYSVVNRGLGVKAFRDDINKELKGDGRVVTGDELDDFDFRKEPTGLPAFDFVTNGGLIRGGASCGWGPEKSLKTTSAAQMIKNYQARGMTCALASVESFDRAWWRRNGVYIPYGGKEVDDLARSERENAKRYNAHFEKRCCEPLTLFLHPNSVRVLDMVVAGSKSNVFDLIVVDSLGAVVDISHVEGKSLEDADFAGNSQIMSRFAAFIQTTFNYKFDAENKYKPTGDFANQTTVYCINQARVTIGLNSKVKMADKLLHPPGGNALKHLWNQNVFFMGSDDNGEYMGMDGRQVRDIVSRSFRLKAVKMRAGPEQRQADLELTIKRRVSGGGRVWQSGQIDVFKSLRAVSTFLEVVEQRGSSLSYGGRKFQGKEKFEIALQKDAGMYQELYKDMIAAAQKDALSISVPRVWE